ncbi:MAG: hypothetical protein ACI4VF_10410, partial [Lachnospirales bacterium]
MRKFIRNFAAMAISMIMCLTSTVPTMAATSQDYVPTVELNNGISLLSEDTTGTSEDYGTSSNGMTILAVDTGYNELEAFDTSSLVVGNMGGVNAPATKTYNSTDYTFSHFEYATSVRNYVASYNREFQFYVDPPMTILAVYTTSTPNPPTGPVVGMYKDPDVKTVDGKERTFYYCSEATQNIDLSNVKPSITFGRSALDENETGSSETFSTQAPNIYPNNNNYTFQFIVASGIKNNGPINFLATAAGAQAMAQIKNWNFGDDAFDSVIANTSRNGITLTDVTAVTPTGGTVTVGGKVFSRGFNTNAAFTVYSGDVVKVYASGEITVTGGNINSYSNGYTIITANTNGTMTISNNGSTIYGITVNMCSSVDKNSATTEGGGSSEVADGAVPLNYSIDFSTDDARTQMTAAGITDLKTATLSNITYNLGTNYKTTGTNTYIKGTAGLTKIVSFKVDREVTFNITLTNANSTDRYIKIFDASTDTVYTTFTSTTNSIKLPAGSYYISNDSSKEVDISSMSFKSEDSGGSQTTTTTGTIYGYVKDSSTNSAISGATVTLSDGQSTTTSINGTYSFTVTISTSNDYTVTASKTGYTDNTANVTAKEGSTQADISLTKEATVQKVT